MKESYNEGIASHIGPESCLDDPRGRGKALTGESTGGLLSSEITCFQRQTSWAVRDCNMVGRADRERPTALAESKILACVDTLRAGIGRSREGASPSLKHLAEASQEKVNRRIPAMSSPEKSDGDIVPGKFANKGVSTSAEQMEGREPTKRKPVNETTVRTQSRIAASNDFAGCVVGMKRKRLRYRSPPKTPLLEVGAVCGSSARTDLCGGRLATAVPTATKAPIKIGGE